MRSTFTRREALLGLGGSAGALFAAAPATTQGQAPNIRALAARLPETTVILDHMGRPEQGTAKEYEEVLKLAELPRVILKFSNWQTYRGDLGRLTHRIYDAFGPERVISGMVGTSPEEYTRKAARFEELLAFATEADRSRIRGGNAQGLFFG